MCRLVENLMRITLRGSCVVMCLAALAAAIPPALAADKPGANALAPHFAKVKGKGLVVAAWAFKDSTAQLDVYKRGNVTRYKIDKEGNVTSGKSPASYDSTALKLARFSAADAAKAALKREERDVVVKAVTFNNEDASFLVALYGGNGRFLGWHRFNSADGKWEGFDEGLGERDPLDLQRPDKPKG